MNYRIQAKQQNIIVTEASLSSAWTQLGLPEGKCPTPAAVAKEAADGEPWYLFEESTGEYIYVSHTQREAHPVNVMSNKYGRL